MVILVRKSHIYVVRCPVYLSLRTGKDLESDKDLVEYFRKVIALRTKDD